MIFGKHINRYYLKHAAAILFGLVWLIVVDALQLEIPALYQMVIDGVNAGHVGGEPFNLTFLVDKICMPMLVIILIIVAGRFLWRVCFFSAGIKAEADLRNRMFGHAKELSRAVNAFLHRLPRRDCDIFVRRCFYAESPEEIASRYHLRPNTVTVSLHRTRKKLREYLHKEGYL